MPSGYLGRTITWWVCQTCQQSFSRQTHPHLVRQFCSIRCANRRGTPEERSARARHKVKRAYPWRWSIPEQWYIPEPNTGCWLWLGGLNQKGYPQFKHQQRTWRAHRFMYERAKGPLPEGLTLDHLCRVRSCVNPDHLEPVTHAENCRRRPSRA